MSTSAPAPRYLEIAAELRRRIESGELAPGMRVPSTRGIVDEWGVAMATATRVLTELRQQGLVRAVPGVGTVVEGARRHVASWGSVSDRRPLRMPIVLRRRT